MVLCLSLSVSLGVSQNLSNGLIAYYPFNGNENDESGNGRHGANNQAVLASDRFGNPNSAYIFNGSSSFIWAPVNVSEVSYTAAFWFCTTNANCGLYAVTDTPSNGSHDRHIYLNSGNLSVRIWDDETIRTSGTNYADGKWHHVAHVYDSAGTPQRIYVDGQMKVTGTKSFSDYTAQMAIIIGFSQDAVTKYAAGQIDEVRLYSRALSSSEITQLYNHAPYTLFALDKDADTIYIIDQVTGSLRPFAVTPFDLPAWPAFDYNPANRKLYLVYNQGSGPALFEVNTQTGSVSSTPTLLIQNEGGNSLGFTSTGDFYIYQERSAFSTGTLHFVNGTSGASTARTTSGASPSVLGGDYDFQNSYFYGTDEWNGKVYRLNPADGSRLWTSTSTWYTGNGSGDLMDMDITPRGEIFVGGSDPGGFRVLHLNSSTGVWSNRLTLPRNADFRLASVPGVIEPPGMEPVVRNHPLSQTSSSGGSVTLSVSAVSPGSNILSNTGFEGTTEGWYAFGGSIASSNSSYTGSNAVSLTKSTGYARLRYSNSLTLTSGISYLASAMVRDSFAANGDEFEFWNDNANGPALVSVRYPPRLTNNVAGGTNWIQVRQLFTCTNNGSGAIMLVAWNPPNNNTYVVDNFEFRPCTTNGLTYQWQKDGVAISNATSASLSLTNLQTNQAGSYQAVVSSTYGSVTSDVAVLTMGSAPVITSSTNASGVVGQFFNMSISAAGSPTSLTVVPATNLPTGLAFYGSPTNAIIGTPSSAVTRSLSVIASNGFGSTTSSLTITIAKGTPVISSWPTASAIAYGQALSNSVLSGGVANPTGNFTWTVLTNRPNAGTNAQSVTFTPSSTSYNLSLIHI